MAWTTFDSSGAQLERSFSDTPVGTITGYAGASAPNGWLLCNGATLSTTAYPELFAVIGYTYGGSGSSFILPNGDGDIIYAQSVSARIDSVTPPQYVTSLPSAPVNGQEIYYAASTASGVIWHLRYNGTSSSSYKWEFIGGQALSNEVATQGGTTSVSYTALGTAGPVITIPLAGDYDIEIGCRGGSQATQYGFMSYDIGVTGAVDADCVYTQDYSVNCLAFPSTVKRKTISAASTTLTSKYKSSTAAATAIFGNRYMRVTPVRVG